MPQPIARIYSSQQVATTVVNELEEGGFSAEVIHAAPPPAAPDFSSGAVTPASSAEPILETILRAGVPAEHAPIYAEHVQRGEVLVVAAQPPFGFARTVTDVMDSHEPVGVDLPEVAPPPPVTWDSAAPLSSWLGWRVLLDDPTPLSNYFKRPVLKREPAFSAILEKIRQRSRDASPLSDKIGMATLSADPAPLSTKFGWRLLSEKAAPLSDKFGWPTLCDDPAPLSKKLGWRVLSDNPTPLSSWLGWRTLSKD